MNDSCFSLPAIKVCILGIDSNQIKLSDIKNGFSLYATNPGFKITGFAVGYHDESKGALYIECHYDGDQFFINKYEPFEQHINGAKRLFIDKITAIKDNRCYYLKCMTYVVIK